MAPRSTALARTLIGLTLLLGVLPSPSVQAATPPYADDAIEAVWRRTDQPVATQATPRTWLWGPAPFASLYEPYEQAPGGWRLVQYYDKSRMEVTDSNADRASPWFVTNGLLARELISGQVQLGDARFEARAPAEVPVAGDADDPAGPTYATLSRVLAPVGERRGPVLDTIDRAGAVGQNGALGAYTDYASFVPQTGHNIPSVFWSFLGSSGPVQVGGELRDEPLFAPTFFATGLPITDAYWARVKVGGQVKDVLIQAYERRVLTYTPSNPAGFQVEMGNIGRHYAQWRYGGAGRGLEAGQVTRVVDGDTYDVQVAGQVKRVRLIGVDTPETVAPGQPVGCYGPEASTAAKALLEGRAVLLEKDTSESDRFGRSLRYVYVEGLFVNDWLVRSGYARVATFPPDVKYIPGLLEAQRYARTTGVGLWGACQPGQPAPTPTATPPPGPTPTPTVGTPEVQVTAWVSNESPAQRTSVTVYGKLTVGGRGVAGVPMRTTWYYRTTTSTCEGTTGSDGVASCSRLIGSATIGYRVRIDVALDYQGRTYTAQTGFTPR